MTIEEFKLERIEFNEQKIKLTAELKRLVKDESIPLEDRWDEFINSELGEEDRFLLSLDCYDLDSFYADCERYATYDVEDIIDYIIDNEEELDNVEYNNLLTEIKEEILDQFICSFVYDW